MSIKEDIRRAAQKVMLTGLLSAVTLSGMSQSSFKRYSQDKKQQFTEFAQQKQQEFKNFKDGKTADFNQFRQGTTSDDNTGKVVLKTSEKPVNVDGFEVYSAGVANGLGLDSNTMKVYRDTGNKGKDYCCVVADNGVAVVYSGDGVNVCGVVENDSVNYYISKQGYEKQKTDLEAAKEFVVTINEIYGNPNSTFSHALANTNAQTQAQVQTQTQNQTQQAQQINEQNLEWHTTQDGSVKYTVNNGQVVFKGQTSGSIEHLMPEVKQAATNSGKKIFQCGSARAGTQHMAESVERMRIQNLVIQQKIYQDMQLRESQGETLLPAEKNFQQTHPKLLEREGLQISQDGSLHQKEPKGNILQMMSYGRSR